MRFGIPISLTIFQFVVIHTVKVFSIVSEAEVDFFFKFLCFLYDPVSKNLDGRREKFSSSVWPTSLTGQIFMVVDKT